MFYIYKIINKLNNKIYVGRHRTEKREPLQDNYYGSGRYIRFAIEKYGKENFEKNILERCESCEQALLREIYWIETLKATDPDIGYNLTASSCGFDSSSARKSVEVKIRKLRENSEYRERYCENMRRAQNRPEVQGRRLETSRQSRMQRTDEDRERLSEKLKTYWRNGGSEKRRAFLKLLFEDPQRSLEYREKLSKAVRNANEREEVKQRRIEAMNNPAYREKRDETLKRLYRDCALYSTLNREYVQPKSCLKRLLNNKKISEEEYLQRVKALEPRHQEILIEIREWRKEHRCE
jgi:hypothetical protein